MKLSVYMLICDIINYGVIDKGWSRNIAVCSGIVKINFLAKINKQEILQKYFRNDLSLRLRTLTTTRLRGLQARLRALEDYARRHRIAWQALIG